MATATPLRCGTPRSGVSNPTAGHARGCTPSTCLTRWRATTTAKPQDGRTSTAEHMQFLSAEVDKVLKATGAGQVVLYGNSRGGNAIRNYIANGGGAPKVSHAILGGTPNHGVWADKARAPNSEFNGAGPFLTALNNSPAMGGNEVTAWREVADHPLRQQRQVRPARRRVDRHQGHTHERDFRRPRAEGRRERGDCRYRPPRNLVQRQGLRAGAPLHHRQGASHPGHHPRRQRWCWVASSAAWV